MGVVRGKRSVKIKEKIKAVQIQSTANLFQGPVPDNITLKAVPQGFTALNYKWYINAGTSIVGTNQTFIIANNQVETTNVYKVVVTSIDGEDFEATISIAKVKDGSAIVAIKRYKDEIEAQRNQLVASFNSLYNNPKIGNYKTTLRTNFTNYNTAYLALINVINTIVTNNNLTPTDEATLDSSIAEYKLKLTAFVESLEMALKLTTNYLDDTIDRINKVTSFLNTTVDNNVIATGVVLVGDGNEGTGGMSGIRDQGQESIFLYSGQTFNNRYSAPFRVTHGGSVVMTNAYVSGHVTATSGTFNGTIYADNGRFSGEINALSGKIGSSVNYFTITDKGLESKNGWIWIGDTTNVTGNRARGVQIVKTDDNFNEPLIRIADNQTVPVHKSGMAIQVNGGVSNTALSLEGDLRITGKIIINGRIIT